MVQYQFALDSAGQVVAANALAGRPVHGSFTCLGCEQPLIARVNGTKRCPHFSHKAQQECNGETYLHRLAKQAFEQTYRGCLAERKPFLISLTSPKICHKYESILAKACVVAEITQEFDLTQYYSRIHVEERNGHFIPDLSLHSVGRKEDVIFIEIAVSHFLSEEKHRSGNRIIEIPIATETDIEPIFSARLTPANATFIGFYPSEPRAVENECRCARKVFYAFVVYNTGKAHLSLDELRLIAARIDKTRQKIKYLNVFPKYETDDDYGHCDRPPGTIFVEQVQEAAKAGAPIRNCYLCRYHAETWEFSSDCPIYCKTFRMPCNSNHAAECERYRVDKRAWT